MMNMKISSLLVLTAITMMACQKNVGKSGSPAPAAPTAHDQAAGGTPVPTVADVKAEDLKYAVAIVYEGGTGNAWMDTKGDKHKALWRLFICLDQSNQEKTVSIPLDLRQLGTPIDYHAVNPSTGQVTWSERLEQVTLNFKYRAQIHQTDRGPELTWGQAKIEGASDQKWQINWPYAASSIPSAPTIELFNIQWDDGNLVGVEQQNFGTNEKPFYISSTVLHVGTDTFGKINPITACEERGQEFFFQTGKQLRK